MPEPGISRLLGFVGAAQEGVETSLLEVSISCESFYQTFMLHDNEGSAIREGPGLVGSRFVEGERLQQKRCGRGHNADGRRSAQLADEPSGPLPVIGRGQAVRKLQQDILSRDNSAAKAGSKLAAGLVVIVRAVEQAEEVETVREDGPHSFACPWR